VIISWRPPTVQILVLIGPVVASSPLCDFFHCPFLSCRLCFYRERARVKPLKRFSRFMAQTTCSRVRKCPLGLRAMGDVIWGNMPQNPLKWAWIGNFKPKRQNIKIAISPKLQFRSRPNLRTNLRPTIALSGWSNVIQIESNIAAGRHLEKSIWRHDSAKGRPSSILTKFAEWHADDEN